MERGAEQFGPVLVGSASGGMNIEEVAATNPEAIIKEHVDMKKGLGLDQAKRMAARMGFAGSSQDEAADYFVKMYNLFVEKVDFSRIFENILIDFTEWVLTCILGLLPFGNQSTCWRFNWRSFGHGCKD